MNEWVVTEAEAIGWLSALLFIILGIYYGVK